MDASSGYMLHNQDKGMLNGKEMPISAQIGVEMHIHLDLYNVILSLTSQNPREWTCQV